MARVADYVISIDGNDVSRAFDPLLISMTVRQTDGGSADSLEIELDDSNGQIELPRVGAHISAALGWSDSGAVVTFEGFTDEPKSEGHHHRRPGRGHASSGSESMDVMSTGGRGQGRVLTITAKSADMHGKIKEPMQAHADKTTFGDVAQKWGTKAGLSSVNVDQALASIQRPYWGIANESFMTWGARMARDLGATFKIFGSTGVFVPRSGGKSASGKPLAGVTAAWGVNLLQWSIAPVLSRPDFQQMAVRYYDPQSATWKTEKASNDGSKAKVKHTERFKAPAQDHAKRRASSNAAESSRDQGGADSVTIDGAPEAQSEASCTVSGIRPGVDGSYTIKDVTHSLSRSGGFTTQLSLRKPSGAAGTDSRSDS